MKSNCAGCNECITGSYVKAIGKQWHPEHFVCTCCKTDLVKQEFLEKDGAAYCKNDYYELFCKKCGKCTKPITAASVNASGKHWHLECFTCEVCNKPIETPRFFEKDGKFYCVEDYHKTFSPICTACNQPILEDYLKAIGQTWHNKCFTCKDCKKPIKQKKFSTLKNQPVCSSCVRKREDKYG